MRILLTGAASHLAAVLLPRLCLHPAVERVIGLDLKPARYHHPRYVHIRGDVREQRLLERIHRQQRPHAVIHLAFVVLRSQLGQQRHNRALIRDINVNGSRAVFHSACAADVDCLIHLSSAAVYGAWPDNPPRLDENQPRRVMRGFSYAEDKNAVEDLLDELQAQATTPRVVCLRPHVILGHNAQPFLTALLRQPFYPRLAPPAPLTQCIWETDVVEAILASLLRPVRGPFNLASEPAMSFEAMQRQAHRLAIPLPFGLLRWSQRRLWRFTAVLEEPGWLDGMPHSLALDCARARHLLDWTPRYDTPACIHMLTRRSRRLRQRSKAGAART